MLIVLIAIIIGKYALKALAWLIYIVHRARLTEAQILMEDLGLGIQKPHKRKNK